MYGAGMTGVKLYDELASLAECVPLQRKHFNDVKGGYGIDCTVYVEVFRIFSVLGRYL